MQFLNFKTIFIICILQVVQLHCQELVLKGKVVDSLNIPLEGATLIAKSISNSNEIKFTSSNSDGTFSFMLQAEKEYSISLSYIGFKPVEKRVVPNQSTEDLLFVMMPTYEVLTGIDLNYKVEAQIIKKDTVVFNVESYTNGNERKLKDQIAKLPGMEVDKKGVVRYQGKEVQTTLVEGDTFFGGGSKIAVENIPANAVDIIVLLDNFSEVDFMKAVNDNDKLVMNIKLKKNKKQFVFGEVAASHALNGFYKYHANLFYYSPTRNYSFIGDANNNGSNAIEFSDIYRLERGNISSYSNKKENMTSNLFLFAIASDRFIKANSKFSALNFKEKLSIKTSFDSYLLYSENKSTRYNDNRILYFNNEVVTNEFRTNIDSRKIDFFLYNFKINSRVSDATNIKYSLSSKKNDNKNDTEIISEYEGNTKLFKTQNNPINKSFNQFFEYNNKSNVKRYQSFVISHNYEETGTSQSYFSNDIFLENTFPLQNDTAYTINKSAFQKTNSFDATYSSYWIPGKNNQIKATVFSEIIFNKYNDKDRQLLTNGDVVNFDASVFGNSLNGVDSRFQLDLNYKHVLKKWTNTFGLITESVNRTYENKDSNTGLKTVNFLPYFRSEYKFSEAHILSLNYTMSNELPSIYNQARGLNIKSFNTVFAGNEELNFIRSNGVMLNYKLTNAFKRCFFNMQLFYIQNNSIIRDEISLLGINQITRPVQINYPNRDIKYKGSFTKKITYLDLTLDAKLGWQEYKQIVNNRSSVVVQNNEQIGFKVKTNKTNWPLMTVGYEKGFNSFKSGSVSKFTTNTFYSEIEIEFLKNFVFNFDYDYNFNSVLNNTNKFELANLEVEYTPKSSLWLFSIKAQNVFNTRVINSNNIYDYYANYNNVYILPRIIMGTVTYKF